jgi:hypothetical protein
MMKKAIIVGTATPASIAIPMDGLRIDFILLKEFAVKLPRDSCRVVQQIAYFC